MSFNPVPGQLGPIHPSQVAQQDRRYVAEERENDQRIEEIRELEEQVEKTGVSLPESESELSVESYLSSIGLDPEAIELSAPGIIANLQAQVNDPENTQIRQQLQFLGQQWQTNPEFRSTPLTAYDTALAESGFDAGGFGGGPPPMGPGAAYAEGFDGGGPNYEVGNTGWIRYKNGVLVNPQMGASGVVFDPTSSAPGSVPWLANVVSQWDEEKVSEWKSRLHQFGYLDKDQAKGGESDLVFREALQRYHINRYLNNGKAVVADASVAGDGGGEEKPPVFNLRDVSAQIRNDVREQYRRIYGTDASDGEVQAWTDYIIRHGMDLQRKFRRKYDTPDTASAVTEAEEMFIEKLENSPEAEYLREADEENTRLRDTFERMAMVTNSLTS